MKAVRRAMGLDLARLGSSSLLTWIIFLVLPIIAAVAFGRSDAGADLIMGTISGMIIGASVMIPVNFGSYEAKDNHLAINGILPIARRSQVAGRYSLVALIDCIAIADYGLCAFMLSMMRSKVTIAEILIPAGTILAVDFVWQSIMFPILYRFTTEKMIQIISVAALTLFFIGFFVIFSIPENITMNIVSWFATHVLFSVFSTIMVVAVIVLMAVTISITLSKRIYEAREL